MAIRMLMAVIEKEILLCIRDKAGLALLFIMPAILVIVITQVQDNLLKTIDAVETRILLVDEDIGEGVAEKGRGEERWGERIASALESMDGIILVREISGRRLSRAEALSRVARGDDPVCVVIPSGLTQTLRNRAETLIKASLSDGEIPDADDRVSRIEVYFDPTLMGGFRSAVQARMELLAFQISVLEKAYGVSHFSENPAFSLPPAFWLNQKNTALVRMDDGDLISENRRRPNPVQQNVPAWTLFGIFFVVLPISSEFIQERANGTRHRLMTMPVSPVALISGRVITYVGICGIQCLLIGCIGKWFLPLWGTSALVIRGSWLAVVVMVFSSILAAVGYGVFLGAMAKTHEQAAVVGPVSVVIAAALGGIMVPVYAMPPFMQKISMISPMAWGLTGILDVFVREEGVRAVIPEASALIVFFLACMTLAHLREHFRRS